MKKSKYIWFNGDIILWDDAKTHVMSHSLHYGSSVFEGIRFYEIDSKIAIFRHRDHIKRLFESAKIYRIPIRYEMNDLMNGCKDIIVKNKLKNGYIRPIVFIGDIGMGVNPKKFYESNVAIAAFEWGSYLGKNISSNGINLMVSSWNRPSPNTIPTLAKAGGNYLSSFLIGNEARNYGYDEGIALDSNGYISEGSGENIFEVKDNIIFTPSYASSILPGITRDTVLKLSKELNFDIVEKFLPRESLYLSDEIFMTGTAVEIIHIRSIDKIKINNGKCGPITSKLKNAFFGLFNGKTKDKWGWLDYIIN